MILKQGHNTCRFINADGIFDTGRQFGQNMYAYCANNPVMFSDPNGKCAKAWAAGFSGPCPGEGLPGCMDNWDMFKTQSTSNNSNGSQGNSYSFTEMKVDTDGTGNVYSGGTHQGQTSYMNGEINAEEHPYVVIPINCDDYWDTMGCIAVVIDHDSGKYVYAIVADGGPEDQYGEVSINVAWDLGYATDGSWGPEGNFELIIFPNTEQDWNGDNLQNQIDLAGKQYYP